MTSQLETSPLKYFHINLIILRLRFRLESQGYNANRNSFVSITDWSGHLSALLCFKSSNCAVITEIASVVTIVSRIVIQCYRRNEILFYYGSVFSIRKIVGEVVFKRFSNYSTMLKFHWSKVFILSSLEHNLCSVLGSIKP